MSKESIRSLLEAKGTFPDKEDISASFEALFALARDQNETVDDLAEGFALALDQWSQVDGVVEPGVAKRLQEWALSQWVPSSFGLCKRLSGLLVNVPSPQVLTFLEAQLEQCHNPAIQRVLSESIAEMTPDDESLAE